MGDVRAMQKSPTRRKTRAGSWVMELERGRGEGEEVRGDGHEQLYSASSSSREREGRARVACTCRACPPTHLELTNQRMHIIYYSLKGNWYSI